MKVESLCRILVGLPFYSLRPHDANHSAQVAFEDFWHVLVILGSYIHKG